MAAPLSYNLQLYVLLIGQLKCMIVLHFIACSRCEIELCCYAVVCTVGWLINMYDRITFYCMQ